MLPAISPNWFILPGPNSIVPTPQLKVNDFWNRSNTFIVRLLIAVKKGVSVEEDIISRFDKDTCYQTMCN
jgi:hypothetical protein